MGNADCAVLADGELAQRIVGAAPGLARDAEQELCRRFGPRVRLYGERHLRDAASAADLAQRVLALTLEKLRKGAVREPDRIGSFILGAARMTAREMRRTRREIPAALDELGAWLEPSDPLPLERLADCLGALGQRERAVVLLTFYLEQTAGEIANALALSPGNIRVIRHRAIDRLRACMGEEVPA